MSDSTTLRTIAPGWYPDPAGTPFERWWDGVGWTVHLQQAGAAGAPEGRVLGRHTPVYTVFIWLFVLLPLVPSMILLSFHSDATAEDSTTRLSYVVGLLLLWLGINFATSVAIIVFAYHDRRTLRRAGVASPFHWAWTFLSSAVYVIGRSAVVKRRVGRGLLPIWVYLIVLAITIVVSVNAEPAVRALLLVAAVS